MPDESKNERLLAMFDAFAVVGNALASPVRLRIIDVLMHGQLSVNGLAVETALPVVTVSQHLQILKRAGLVRGKRAGRSVLNCIADESIVRLWLATQEVAKRNVVEFELILDGILDGREDLQAITADELEVAIANDEVTIIDVRPGSDWKRGHIPNARSMPIEQLELMLDSNPRIPKRKPVVAYCRGPYCVHSDDAVRMLNAKGFRAKRLVAGYPGWLALGDSPSAAAIQGHAT